MLRKTSNSKIKLMRGNSQWMEGENTCEDCRDPQDSGPGRGFAGSSHAGAVWPQSCPQALLSPSRASSPQPGISAHAGGDSPSLGDAGPGGLSWISTRTLLSPWPLQPVPRLVLHWSAPGSCQTQLGSQNTWNTQSCMVQAGWAAWQPRKCPEWKFASTNSPCLTLCCWVQGLGTISTTLCSPGLSIYAINQIQPSKQSCKGNHLVVPDESSRIVQHGSPESHCLMMKKTLGFNRLGMAGGFSDGGLSWSPSPALCELSWAHTHFLPNNIALLHLVNLCILPWNI